jgi:formiminoglutamase
MTRVARAIVDVNRSVGDRRADGVVKTHTCWNVPIYREPLSAETIEQLLERYYVPYHRQLSECAERARLGVDCHTMAAMGPPIGPGPGLERPRICLGNADGTCPEAWIECLVRCFERAFGPDVKVNDPFSGGHIVRSHAAELPWVQLEISRAPFLSNAEKRERVRAALRDWCDGTSGG